MTNAPEFLLDTRVVLDRGNLRLDAELQVHHGEVVAIMGPNGSGKSTLAHILMGRPGYEITQGNIMLNGEDITNKPTWQRAQLGLEELKMYPASATTSFINLPAPAPLPVSYTHLTLPTNREV